LFSTSINLYLPGGLPGINASLPGSQLLKYSKNSGIQDSKFTLAPLSGKRYIVNKTLDIFLIIEDSKVEITNHVYHYVTTLAEREIEKITNYYDQKVEGQRINYEDQIKSQITNTLHSIYEKIIKQSTDN
jgi:hypothetical protein